MSRLCPQVSWTGIHVNSSPPWPSIVARLETLPHRRTDNNNQWKFAHFQRPSCDQIADQTETREFLVVRATRKSGVCQGSTRACREKKKFVWSGADRVAGKNRGSGAKTQINWNKARSRDIVRLSTSPTSPRDQQPSVGDRPAAEKSLQSPGLLIRFRGNGEAGGRAPSMHWLDETPIGRCGQDPYGCVSLASLRRLRLQPLG
ncbi:hypothetical protein GQ607_002349 [Colletotrichum asianum]|uniref:Uncharacterized protein n=1 Tax=Colletotrichum asianum TaxID=702518 RepID=A0A8H3WPM9_9PEZI|nr:hypothetical protein GQ607_002349 [Colletotrichum asianum]